MIRVCQKCGVENGAAAIHCRNCRTKLPEPSAGMIMTPPSSRPGSVLRSVLWVVVLLAVGTAGFWAKENMNRAEFKEGMARLYQGWQQAETDARGALRRWYAKWLSAEPQATPPVLSSNVVAPVSNAPAVPIPKREVKIRCPNCEGFGSIWQGDKSRKMKAACPICNQAGGRTVTLPDGVELCPDCKGMGRLAVQMDESVKANTRRVGGTARCILCQMCLGRGVIVRKY